MISIIKFLIMINLCKIYCTCRFHTHSSTILFNIIIHLYCIQYYITILYNIVNSSTILQVPYTQNYTGSWVAGVKEGFGAMFWKDGDRFSSSLMSNEFYGLFRGNASEDKIFQVPWQLERGPA